MLLTGHEGAVLSVCFDKLGQNIVSSSQDRQICIFHVLFVLTSCNYQFYGTYMENVLIITCSRVTRMR